MITVDNYFYFDTYPIFIGRIMTFFLFHYYRYCFIRNLPLHNSFPSPHSDLLTPRDLFSWFPPLLIFFPSWVFSLNPSNFVYISPLHLFPYTSQFKNSFGIRYLSFEPRFLISVSIFFLQFPKFFSQSAYFFYFAIWNSLFSVLSDIPHKIHF